MRSVLPIFTAALAAVAAMWNAVSRKDDDPPAAVEATIIPPMTPALVQKYAYFGGTDTEIADCFLVDESLLRSQFADMLRSARGYRRIILRGYQFESAKKTNASILTWLGRNELGQSLNPTMPGEAEPVFVE